RLDVALRTLAHVVELGDGAQVLLPVALGALFGFGQRLLQPLDILELRCRLRQHGRGLRRTAAPLASGLVGSHLAQNLRKIPKSAGACGGTGTPGWGISGANSRPRRAV